MTLVSSTLYTGLLPAYDLPKRDRMFCVFSRVSQNTPRASVHASRGRRRTLSRDTGFCGRAVQHMARALRDRRCNAIRLTCTHDGIQRPHFVLPAALALPAPRAAARTGTTSAGGLTVYDVSARVWPPHWHCQRRCFQPPPAPVDWHPTRTRRVRRPRVQGPRVRRPQRSLPLPRLSLNRYPHSRPAVVRPSPSTH